MDAHPPKSCEFKLLQPSPAGKYKWKVRDSITAKIETSATDPNKSKRDFECLWILLNNVRTDTGVTLAELLDRADAKYTLFAPNDKAFVTSDRWLKSHRLPRMEDLSPGLMRGTLLYHILPETVLGMDLVDGATFRTMEGKSLCIFVHGGKIRVNHAIVTRQNIPAANGVIHIIDTVLMPVPQCTDIGKGKGLTKKERELKVRLGMASYDGVSEKYELKKKTSGRGPEKRVTYEEEWKYQPGGKLGEREVVMRETRQEAGFDGGMGTSATGGVMQNVGQYAGQAMQAYAGVRPMLGNSPTMQQVDKYLGQAQQYLGGGSTQTPTGSVAGSTFSQPATTVSQNPLLPAGVSIPSSSSATSFANSALASGGLGSSSAGRSQSTLQGTLFDGLQVSAPGTTVSIGNGRKQTASLSSSMRQQGALDADYARARRLLEQRGGTDGGVGRKKSTTSAAGRKRKSSRAKSTSGVSRVGRSRATSAGQKKKRTATQQGRSSAGRKRTRRY